LTPLRHGIGFAKPTLMAQALDNAVVIGSELTMSARKNAMVQCQSHSWNANLNDK